MDMRRQAEKSKSFPPSEALHMRTAGCNPPIHQLPLMRSPLVLQYRTNEKPDNAPGSNVTRRRICFSR